jgi:hypothetical protein
VNELPEDFRDLLLELADVGAEFVLVGGHAVAFHGHPPATKDMDVLIRANTNNAERVYRALADFGAPLSAYRGHDNGDPPRIEAPAIPSPRTGHHHQDLAADSPMKHEAQSATS